MKIIESGAVYDGYDKIIGFRCSACGEVFGSMFGDTCNQCQTLERRHQELIQAIKNAKS
jgi:hypothetical protein